jgi:hypothetical protein
MVGLGLLAALIVVALADRANGWVAPAFDAVAHQFYEVPVLARVRRPTQLPLVRAHLAIFTAMAAAGCLLAPRLGTHGRRWWAILCVGYAIRAIIWIAGGNLPLVPGDSCHYLEVASSVDRGEGPVKHYAESFFIDYPAIRRGEGVLDDWATPLYAYVLAGAYRLTGIEPGRSIEETVAVAKAVSFLLSLLALPALYGFARRTQGREVGLWSMAALAILPVHALYAGFALRESLVALTSLLAVWFLLESWRADGPSRWGWAVLAGICGGLAILARNTAMALLAAAGLYGLIVHGRRRLGPLLAWGLVTAAVIAPWAWATYRAYGEPFYTYTKHFQHTFSWTVHHYRAGVPRAADFYTRANAPEIARVKIKSLLIIVIYSSMIVGLPLVLGFARRLRRPVDNSRPDGRDADRLALSVLAAFVLATLANVADVTQVAQLGRYYLPVYVVALPTAVAGLRDWLRSAIRPEAVPWACALIVPLLWSDPTWAYDYTWLVKPYQLHWPALRAAGDWVREHPEAVPDDARIMTWFPWEFRLASQRTTILMPRSFSSVDIDRVIKQYGVTHVLWGSFEPPPNVDPESFGPFLERLRLAAGLTDRRELYRSPTGRGAPDFPVRLYRLRGGNP